MTYAEQIAHLRSVACPRCNAQPGQPCTTPNGYSTWHKARDRALNGIEPAPRRKGLRLTEAQAERIEATAAYGDYYAPAPGGRSTFGGDAAERAVVTALLDKGLFEMVGLTDEKDLRGEARYRLTTAGWRVYATHKLIIRRDGVTIPEGVLDR